MTEIDLSTVNVESTVDARGSACPGPLLEAKKGIANFVVTCLGKNHEIQRCLACYPSENEKDEKAHVVQIANARIEKLYRDFDQSSVHYEKCFFTEPGRP